MLKKFEVKNFKNFKDKFIFDLSTEKSYEFNPQCVSDKIVTKSLIYGSNGCGKTNLGRAIFDIKQHLTDSEADPGYENYLHADNESGFAEFIYTFQFENAIVEYSYGKKSVDEIVYEILKINDKKVISLDRRHETEIFVDLKGAETLNKKIDDKLFPLSTKDNNLSALKYVHNNTVLDKNDINKTFKKFYVFVENMMNMFSVNHNTKDTLLKAFIGIFNVKELKSFEDFLHESNIKCKITTIEVDREKRLAFQFKNKSIEFGKIASLGTLNLTAQYLILSLIKARSEGLELYKKSIMTENKSDDFKKLVEDLSEKNCVPFVFFDEFDAFYHHEVSKHIVEKVKDFNCQVVFTTHNTGIMSNRIFRPDCLFVMDDTKIQPVYKMTKQELRKAHNLEKLYKGGAFS